MAGRPEHANDYRPIEERTVQAKMVSTRPILPTEEEIKMNPRSRSARMRAIRKLSND
jgi:16S rRNA (cytosine1402-N4)-methyltransferase